MSQIKAKPKKDATYPFLCPFDIQAYCHGQSINSGKTLWSYNKHIFSDIPF